MFNKTIHNNTSTVTPVTRVVEKTITPDRITDMYDKVREEVELDILRKIAIDNGLIKAAVVLRGDSNRDAYQAQYRFVLNGQEFTGEVTFTSNEAVLNRDVYRLIYKRFIEAVARGIFKEFEPVFFTELKK